MFYYIITTLGFIFLLILVTLLTLTLKFYINKKREKVEWGLSRPVKFSNVRTVKSLSLLPLVEYNSQSIELIGEPGVSYLIKADHHTILMDVGYNRKNEHPSPLLKNMKKLGVRIEDIKTIIISHLHRDHIGGNKYERLRTFAMSAQEPDLTGKKVYAPTKISHPTAQVELVSEPRKLAEGIYSIGPINRSIWLMGMTAEHSLAVNVEGKGIVLIIGCGHQRIDRIIKRTQQLFDIPIYGIIGGLHYPVTASRLPYNIQRIFSTGKLPWQRIDKEDVYSSIDLIKEIGPKIIALSPHDSCDWTLATFKDAFGDKFLDIRVGQEIKIS